MEKKADTVLVIGIHREELAFGKQVAAILQGSKINVVQIDTGLSHKRSHYRSGFYHSTAHREMYLQLHQQLARKNVALLIDLHTGINETGRCADILSANIDLLKKMDALLKGVEKHTFSAPGEEHLFEIVPRETKKKKENSIFPACHAILPEKVWNSQTYIYAGLEIYLNETGQGTSSDWEYAAGLVRMLMGSLKN